MIEFQEKNLALRAALRTYSMARPPHPPLYALVRIFQTPTPHPPAYVLIECPRLWCSIFCALQLFLKSELDL